MNVSRRKSASWIYLLGAVSCAGSMTLAPATLSLAAESPVSAGAVLEEVVVTAERRAANLQSVPITIDAVTAEIAEDRGANSIQTLFATIPNLTFTTASFATNTYIRGVGDNSASPNNEPSAAVYIDGVYNPAAMGLTSYGFNNIERIEVLKGPQGTLFGRNATAGVIQIITPDPKHELGGNFEAGYGNYDTIDANLYLTGGLTDKLAADLAVDYIDERQGYGHNVTFNVPTFRYENFAARTKWLYELSDATAFRLSADYGKLDSDGTSNQFVPGSFPPYLGRYNSQGNPTSNETKQYSTGLTIDHDFTGLHFKSITSYRYMEGAQFIDSDITPAFNNHIVEDYDADYFTQELQLGNRNPGRVTWLAGAYYYTNVVNGANPRIQTGAQLAQGYRRFYGTSHTDSGSLFGQATADIFAKTKLTLGLRYTEETLKADGRTENQAGGIVAGPFHDQFDSNPWTWRVALDYQFTPDVMSYISWNRGFKSGGYNLTSPGSAPFFPEGVDAYELGLKSEYMDHRLRLNLATFYYDYTDIQVAVVLGGAQLFTNAAAARNYGLDASVDFAATDRLTLSAALGLLNAKYEDYPGARGYTPFGVAFNIANAKGADLPFSPPITGFVNATYRVPTSIGEFKGTANLAYNDRSFVTPDMGLARPAYELLNASVEWRSQAKDYFAVRLWGTNLTNAEYYIFASESATGWYVSDGPPRRYGMSVEKHF
jgi:iron complex outermembrane recepter protein